MHSTPAPTTIRRIELPELKAPGNQNATRRKHWPSRIKYEDSHDIMPRPDDLEKLMVKEGWPLINMLQAFVKLEQNHG